MARDPDLENHGHIDPGNPPFDLGQPDEPGVKYRTNRYPGNPDPINRPRPLGAPPEDGGPWFGNEADVMPKAKPETGHVAKRRPVREGPDYTALEGEDDDVPPSFTIELSIDRFVILPRTRWILDNVVPTALRSFIRHNLQYRDTDEKLGLQGQFAEIYHITAKLKRQIWDRRNPESVAKGEVQEQLESLIGHALLALDLLEKGNKDGRG